MTFAPAAASFTRPSSRYRGRFAPSPTGLLHAGSLVAALASWLDARAHGGAWLVRIEDIDPPRCWAGADEGILAQLAALGLHADEPVVRQSQRGQHYAQCLEYLQNQQLSYPCICTRARIEAALVAANHGQPLPRHAPRPYPRICRRQRLEVSAHSRAAWRLDMVEVLQNMQQNNGLSPQWHIDPAGVLHWTDRALGAQHQAPAAVAGDIVLRRADGLWAYPLAVVADDAASGITHIVRGADLADQTPAQIALQAALHLPTPRYLHVPLVRMPDGEKLSKQHGAAPIDTSSEAACRAALAGAAQFLQLPSASADASRAQMLAFWVGHWGARYGRNPA